VTGPTPCTCAQRAARGARCQRGGGGDEPGHGVFESGDLFFQQPAAGGGLAREEPAGLGARIGRVPGQDVLLLEALDECFADLIQLAQRLPGGTGLAVLAQLFGVAGVTGDQRRVDAAGLRSNPAR
jgi:hypothetical protein